MERLQRDETYFELLLEEEQDQERRRLILIQIREIKTKILQLTREERARVQRENRLFEEALEKLKGLPDSKKPK